MTKVAAFSAIAISVLALVMLVFHRPVKPVLGLLDLIANLRKIGQFEWSTILINDVFQ
jgi:hypothetical protein